MTATVTYRVTVPEDVHAVTLFGAHDEVLKAVEEGFPGVDVHARGNLVTLTGGVGDVTVAPGYEQKVTALPVVVGLWGQLPDVAAEPVLDLVTGEAGEYRDLTPGRALTRAARSVADGRLRKDRRMPMRVTVLE